MNRAERAEDDMDDIYDLAPVPRMHYAASENGCTDTPTHRRLMREWYELTPVRGTAWWEWARCPHRLAGVRCPTRDPMNCALVVPYRMCGIWDHGRAWRDVRGDLVVTLEPWGNPFDRTDEFAELERELQGLDIATAFEGRSPYGASYVLFMAATSTVAGARMAWYSRRHAPPLSKPT